MFSIQKIESKPSQLPWLENKRMLREAEKEKEEKNRNVGFGVPAIRTLPPKKYVSGKFFSNFRILMRYLIHKG